MNKILENDKKRVFTKNVNTLIMFSSLQFLDLSNPRLNMVF